MITIPKMSRPAAASVAAFGILSLIGAWLVVLGGGFHADSVASTEEPTFVGGVPGAFMAALQFLAALLSFAAIFAQFNWSKRSPYLFAGALVVLPLLTYIAAIRS